MLGLGNGLITPTVSDQFSNAKSLVLDGAGDYVRIEDNAAFRGLDAFSFTAWIKADSKADYKRVIDYSSTAGNENIKFRLAWNGATDQKIYTTISLQNGSQYTAADTSAMPLDTWTQYTVTFNKNLGTARLKLWKNGNTTPVAVTNCADSALNNVAAGPIVIGAQLYGPGSYWDGKIDEVAIWNVALDADAVEAIYNDGKPFNLNHDKGNYDNTEHLIGYWRMFDTIGGDNDEVSAGTLKGIIHDAHETGVGTLGPELWVASEPLTSHLSILGSNTAAIEDGAYKITYGGSVNGFTLKFQNTGTGVTSTDLTVGAWYKVKADWKLVGTSGDNITARVFSGTSWNALEGLTVSHGNDFETKTIYFKSNDTVNGGISIQNNFSSGETVYLKNVSIRRLNGYPGWANADATSSTDTP